MPAPGRQSSPDARPHPRRLRPLLPGVAVRRHPHYRHTVSASRRRDVAAGYATVSRTLQFLIYQPFSLASATGSASCRHVSRRSSRLSRRFFRNATNMQHFEYLKPRLGSPQPREARGGTRPDTGLHAYSGPIIDLPMNQEVPTRTVPMKQAAELNRFCESAAHFKTAQAMCRGSRNRRPGSPAADVPGLCRVRNRRSPEPRSVGRRRGLMEHHPGSLAR